MKNQEKIKKCPKLAQAKAEAKIGSYNQVNSGIIQSYPVPSSKEWKRNYGDLIFEIWQNNSSSKDSTIVMRGLELVEISCDSGRGIRQKTIGALGERLYIRPEEQNVQLTIKGIWLQNDCWRSVENAFFKTVAQRYRISSPNRIVLCGEFMVTDYRVGNREWGFPYGSFSLRSSGEVDFD